MEFKDGAGDRRSPIPMPPVSAPPRSSSLTMRHPSFLSRLHSLRGAGGSSGAAGGYGGAADDFASGSCMSALDDDANFVVSGYKMEGGGIIPMCLSFLAFATHHPLTNPIPHIVPP